MQTNLRKDNVLKKSLKYLFSFLPLSLQGFIRARHPISKFLNPTLENQKYFWMKNVYKPFIDNKKKDIYLSIAKYCQANRPINGYYFEFGSHNARTFKIAWDTFRHLFDWEYIAFDSFEGLPEIDEIDKQEVWEKGKLSTSEEEFINRVLSFGVPREKFRTVKGFYEDSLTPELSEELLPKKAAVIMVDCDLYKSTVPVLKFIRPFLQRGTIIFFDDWNFFHGDPNKGERRAFREFREEFPEMRFGEFVSSHDGKAFFYLGDS